MIRMQVEIVGLDQASMQPIVILTDMEKQGILPLTIGEAEATAISLALEKVEPPRPLTHDLLKSVLTNLRGKVEKAVITDLQDDVFYATIYLKVGDRSLTIDARPSDSIALALRTDSPIFVSEEVLNQALILRPIGDEDMETFKQFLDNIGPDDFRKKMS